MVEIRGHLHAHPLAPIVSEIYPACTPIEVEMECTNGDRTLEDRASDAFQELAPFLDEAIRRVVTGQLGHDDWPGDVDPLSQVRMNDSVTSIIRQLIEGGEDS
jgi:hypothetical protein